TYPGHAHSVVPVVRVDDLQLRACHFFKLDVEGMERQALLGAADTVRRFRPLLYVEDDRQDRSAELRACIQGLGYELYVHTPPLRIHSVDGGTSPRPTARRASATDLPRLTRTANPNSARLKAR